MDMYVDPLAGTLPQEPGVNEPSFKSMCGRSSHSEIKEEHLTTSLRGDIKQFISSEGCNFNPILYSPRIPPSIEVPPMGPFPRSKKVQKSVSLINPSTTELNTSPKTSTSSIIADFQNPLDSPKQEKKNCISSLASEWTEEAIAEEGVKKTHAQDHIMAERKRREKLSQRFIELSSVIPGLKKMDKASVLSDAVKYVKQLQEKVKSLEDKNIDPTFVIMKSRLIRPTDDNSSSDDNFDRGASTNPFSEFELKLSGRTVLVRIHCEKRKGALAKVLTVIESCNLIVTSATAIPFTGLSLDITITAQIDGEVLMTANDLSRKLSSAFNRFM